MFLFFFLSVAALKDHLKLTVSNSNHFICSQFFNPVWAQLEVSSGLASGHSLCGCIHLADLFGAELSPEAKETGSLFTDAGFLTLCMAFSQGALHLTSHLGFLKPPKQELLCLLRTLAWHWNSITSATFCWLRRTSLASRGGGTEHGHWEV